VWVPPAPGPVASLGSRVGARLIDSFVLLLVGWLLIGTLVPSDRPFARLTMAALLVWGYETAMLASGGATVGKRACGLRVVVLDDEHGDRLTAGVAARRAAVDGALTAVPVIGWAFWLVLVAIDPIGRGTADRAASTMVVPERAIQHVRSIDLPGFADGARVPPLTTLGRVAELDLRVRARLRRLTDAPLLSLLAGLAALTVAVKGGLVLRIVVLSVWVVAFVVDESRRVHRNASTIGHRLGGLVIVDRRTGEAPSAGRSVVRAVVLGLTLYVPILWPLLFASLGMMAWSDTGRGLHDRFAGTIVVGDPRRDPEEQRQVAMRLRLGQVD
jgi:uncharacterized RDD family membrane protein YckC